MGTWREVPLKVTNTAFNSNESLFLKAKSRLKLSSARVIFLAAIVCISGILMFYSSQIVTLPITTRYERCGHIVLVSTRRHGSTWFISNADGCLSVNGSYGDISKKAELWHHGHVKNATVEEAIDLVQFNRSLKIFPPALYRRKESVRAFLEATRDLKVPTFVLRRRLEDTFVSLQKARTSHVWNTDRGGAVTESEIEPGEFEEQKSFLEYKRITETFFEDMKSIMNDVGVRWDEFQYEDIASQRIVFGETAKCYIENCNFQ